jgi:ubiquinone/menaquinone biosynthesis C-methylase UbiE
VNDRLVDRDYLTGVQYASDANLSSRQAIYRFQQPLIHTAAWALDLAGLNGGERILDIGCGNGLHLGELARREHRGAVYGMDLSLGMLTAARSHSPTSLFVGDAQRLPFRDGSFDCLLAMHMLYHVPDRDLALSEMSRLSRPGGVALALTNSHRHLEELNSMVGSVLHDITGADPASLRSYLRFSSESGEAELRRHFSSVERRDVTSELIVTDVDAIIAYVASMGSVGQSTAGAGPEVLREVERRARATIESEGAFRIRTEVGCFVCREFERL